MPKGKKSLRKFLGTTLRNKINFLADYAKLNCQEFQRGDNKQGAEHCVTVENNLDLLIPDPLKKNGLNQTEVFVLLAAAHLHDIGKIEGSERLGWKSDHGCRSKEIINEHYDKFGIDRVQAAAVGYVVGVHGNGNFDELPSKPMLVGTDEIDLIKLAAIFRLADMLDTTYQRVPEIVSKILFPHGDVPDKWLARQAISGWTLDDKNRIKLQAIPADEELRVAYTLHGMLNEDLAKMAPHLRIAGYPCELAQLDCGEVRPISSHKNIADREYAFPGMAYYEEEDATIFRGRDEEIERLVSWVSNSPITLLIGESGAGKTSLIHAGLLPRLKSMRWHCVLTRPLDHPREVIRDLIWRSTLDGPVNAELDLWTVMKLAADKCMPRNILIVMDQFEDVLSSPQSVLVEMVKDLVTVQAGSVMPNLRVLISFREDSYVRLSTRLLKAITGSARQFPSVELERLTREGSKRALLAGLELARIGLDPRQDLNEKPLIDIILDDIQQADDRIYPPYLQMVAETLCKHLSGDIPIIDREKYYSAGGANQIIAQYLFSLLDEFGPKKDNACKVLIFLTSSGGKKAQQTVSTLHESTGIKPDEIQAILEKMINLRMARRTATDQFEIINDYLGRMVDDKLVNQEYRDIKFIQEQISSAQRLYEIHKEPIKSSIVLSNLYSNRPRIVLDNDKMELLLCSFIWNNGILHQFEEDQPRSVINSVLVNFHERDPIKGGWFWIHKLEHSDLMFLVAGLIKHMEQIISKSAAGSLVALANSDDLEFIVNLSRDDNPDVRLAAVKILGKLGIDKVPNLIVEMLKDINDDVRMIGATAFAALVSHDNLDLIISMLNEQNENVQNVAREAFAKIVSRDDMKLIAQMLKDNDPRIRLAAVDSLTMIGIQDDLHLIVDLFEDEDNDVQRAAVMTYAKFASHNELHDLYNKYNEKAKEQTGLIFKALDKCLPKRDLKSLNKFSKKYYNCRIYF